jgi:2-hydroxychromene-2-carboxylate isomerase
MTKTIDYFFGVGSPWAFIGFDSFLERHLNGEKLVA